MAPLDSDDRSRSPWRKPDVCASLQLLSQRRVSRSCRWVARWECPGDGWMLAYVTSCLAGPGLRSCTRQLRQRRRQDGRVRRRSGLMRFPNIEADGLHRQATGWTTKREREESEEREEREERRTLRPPLPAPPGAPADLRGSRRMGVADDKLMSTWANALVYFRPVTSLSSPGVQGQARFEELMVWPCARAHGNGAAVSLQIHSMLPVGYPCESGSGSQAEMKILTITDDASSPPDSRGCFTAGLPQLPARASSEQPAVLCRRWPETGARSELGQGIRDPVTTVHRRGSMRAATYVATAPRTNAMLRQRSMRSST